MEKLADVRFPVHEVIARRWSPVTFSERPVSAEQLGSLIEAARWAASCYNEQPWRFIVATKEEPESYAKLLGCLVEKNKAWAQSAPVLMVAVAAQSYEGNGKPNHWAEHDVGMAVMSILFEATAVGLRAHPMAGFDNDAVREAFGVPEGYKPMTAIAVGYMGDMGTAAEEHRQRDEALRSRRPIESLAFSRTWGKTAWFIEESDRKD
ncbi:MAG TPA: nitroreductase [Candidatus Hydrogenedentes bacterium]|nr:nitroreductase [Candidatus Hydrogenedentota bacterium]